ncbi:recombinase RecA [Pyrobaculum ferrireducens]|uniref:recombinase RecA n=1 Tax=Pyrobaculum ferrireducens TaxID=1104324 RepID=UPI0011E55553|nr:recombinase RecA [Pyrobaculum ferrireducens]
MSAGCNLEELFSEGVIVVKGLPGAGKTLLVAKAVSRFRKATWFTFYETEERLRRYLASVGTTPPAYIFDMVTTGEKAVVEYIVEKVAQLRPDVVVVDGVNAIAGEGERELVHAVFYHGISRESPVIFIKEGVEVTPADYIADVIIEVEHQVYESGASIRYVKLLKTRGKPLKYAKLPFVITESGPFVITPIEKSKELPSDRLTTGAPEIDEAIGGGVWRGTLVAVVGPPDGLASKLMVLTAAELARRGSRVLYHHHKVAPTFTKFAESLGVRWQVPNIEWFYHPVVEHKSLTWWFKSAEMVNRGRFDVHFADQYEQVVSSTGPELLVEAARLYQSLVNYPTTTVLVFNSYDAWDSASLYLGSLVDYVFKFRHGELEAHTPESPVPIRFQFKIDEQRRRVVYTRM